MSAGPPALRSPGWRANPSVLVARRLRTVDEAAFREKIRPMRPGARMRARWLSTARDKQVAPGPHALCWAEDCAAVQAEAREAWPLRDMAPERDAYCAERGHVPWHVWCLLAGRGWGKTRVGAEEVARRMVENPGRRVALVAPTFSDGRDTMVEGESGLMAVIPRSLVENWNRSLGELVLRNSSRARIFSAETPERLRGPQHHDAWCDELAAWTRLQSTWDMLMFGLRLGPNPQVIITTTPKPYRFIRKLVRDAGDPRNKIVMTSGSTRENRRHLPSTVISKLEDTYAGTRLGRQELDAEVLEDLGEGVVRLADIERRRVEAWQVQDAAGGTPWPELFDRIAVAVDPAVTANKTSDETGIAVVGRTAGPCFLCGMDENPRRRQHGVVLESWGGRVTDHEWATRLRELYGKWRADVIVAEVNNGGDLVESVIKAGADHLPVEQVRATRGKVVRAEPVGALYEQGVVHHLGTYPILEDQLCNLGMPVEELDPDGLDPDNPDSSGSRSPDRADALVWAVTDLFVPEGKVVTVRHPGQVVDVRGRGSR